MAPRLCLAAFFALFSSLALADFPGSPKIQEPPESHSGTITVFLVRHAEKADYGDDPELTPRGRERASQLALVLGDAGLTHIWTTDYERTRETAAPLSSSTGLGSMLYDPRALPAFAHTLKQTPGVHLVVGHSNTTPALVELLGGDPGIPIREADEYDRLYVVFLPEPGTVGSSLLRYDSD